MSVFEHYFINWQLKGTKQLQTSKYSFPIWRAYELIESANANFGTRDPKSRAHHWLGDQDVEEEFIHPHYGGDKDALPELFTPSAVL